jgi:DNA-binding PadR family transcriptional regulator
MRRVARSDIFGAQQRCGRVQMSAKYAILGLVIERPGYGYQLAQRLEERFGSSAFAPSGVYSALDQLSRDAFVRAAGEVGPGPARRAAPRMIYEATDEGVDHFEAWILGSSPTPPLREELHMKIALCRPRNLPRLIDLVYGQELACMGRLRDLEHSCECEVPRDSQDWPRLMRVLAREAEIALWKARIEWLQSARELLEGLRDGSRRPDTHGALAAAGGQIGRLRAF